MGRGGFNINLSNSNDITGVSKGSGSKAPVDDDASKRKLIKDRKELDRMDEEIERLERLKVKEEEEEIEREEEERREKRRARRARKEQEEEEEREERRLRKQREYEEEEEREEKRRVRKQQEREKEERAEKMERKRKEKEFEEMEIRKYKMEEEMELKREEEERELKRMAKERKRREREQREEEERYEEERVERRKTFKNKTEDKGELKRRKKLTNDEIVWELASACSRLRLGCVSKRLGSYLGMISKYNCWQCTGGTHMLKESNLDDFRHGRQFDEEDWEAHCDFSKRTIPRVTTGRLIRNYQASRQAQSIHGNLGLIFTDTDGHIVEIKRRKKLSTEQILQELAGECPEGYDWAAFENGWQCTGGGHLLKESDPEDFKQGREFGWEDWEANHRFFLRCGILERPCAMWKINPALENTQVGIIHPWKPWKNTYRY